MIHAGTPNGRVQQFAQLFQAEFRIFQPQFCQLLQVRREGVQSSLLCKEQNFFRLPHCRRNHLVNVCGIAISHPICLVPHIFFNLDIHQVQRALLSPHKRQHIFNLFAILDIEHKTLLSLKYMPLDA